MCLIHHTENYSVSVQCRYLLTKLCTQQHTGLWHTPWLQCCIVHERCLVVVSALSEIWIITPYIDKLHIYSSTVSSFKYTIRSIVCEAYCHLGHLITWSLGHLVTFTFIIATNIWTTSGSRVCFADNYVSCDIFWVPCSAPGCGQWFVWDILMWSDITCAAVSALSGVRSSVICPHNIPTSIIMIRTESSKSFSP